MDPLTIMSICFGIISGLDHLLAFSPDGYPKSLGQALLWVCHKIYCRCRKKQSGSDYEPVSTDIQLVVI